MLTSDLRQTLSGASALVAYLRDGGFVDARTEAVHVKFVTFLLLMPEEDAPDNTLRGCY